MKILVKIIYYAIFYTIGLLLYAHLDFADCWKYCFAYCYGGIVFLGGVALNQYFDEMEDKE